MSMAYHVETQPPYGTNASDDANAGTFTIGILGSDGAEELPPDSYTIFFSRSSGITETNSFCVTTSFGHQTNTWQYHTFSLDDLKYYFEDPAGQTIYYRVRANNEANYNFSTLTNQQSWSLYNGVPFEFNQTDWSAPTGTDACDDPKILDGTPAPTTPTVQVNYKEGTVTVDWDIASGTYQYPPERYAIGFGLSDDGSMPYAVSTGNVGDTNALNTEYTFTADYLNTTFNEAHGLFNVKIRSDNDTNSSYSAWSSTVQTTIQNKPAWVDDFSYTLSNTGALISWTKDDTGFVPVDNFKIWVREGDGEWTLVTTLSNTTTSFAVGHTSVTEDTQFQWNLQACGSEGDCNTAGPITYTWEYVAPTLGPPMNTEASNVYDSGVRVKWDAPNTGNQTADSYELYYRTSAENETVITGITETEYTIPYANIPNGTYTFSIRAVDTDNSINSAFSTEPTLEVFNQKAQDDADAAAAEAARKAEEERKRKEAEAELQRQRDKNLSETGYSETDAERSAREKKEYEEEQARIKAEMEQNQAETGYYETDQERADREYQEEQDRLAELQRQRDKNKAETGYSETDEERAVREAEELAAEQARIEEEIKNAFKTDDTGGGEPLTKEEEEELEELINVIIELEETLEVIEIEEEVFELPEEIIVVTTTTTTTTTLPPIKEEFEEDEVLQEEPELLEVEEEVELTEEEIEVLVDEVEEAITEVVEVEELDKVFEEKSIEVIEEEELETLSEEEVEEYVEAVEEAVAEVVKELPTEKKVEVVKEVAKAKVQNLATADVQTKAVVKAVVQEVTKVETVAELDEEEKEAVGELLGFEEETAAEDVEIIAEVAAKEEVVAEAVEEYVERAIENADVENYTLADVVTEVQVEVFLDDPVGAIIDIDLENITISNIGSDMTSDQKEKAQEVVVPVIIASQTIANAGALIRRPF